MTNQGPLAKKISALRELKGLSKKGIDGISASSMQKIENENSIPSNTMLAKLAKALGGGDTEKLLQELKQLAAVSKQPNQTVQPHELPQPNHRVMQDEWITFGDMAKQELIPPIKSPADIKKVVENYLKLLLTEFDAATDYLINPGPKILAQRKKQLKGLTTERRFPCRGINLLKKYQQNQQAGTSHKVSRDEIWGIIGEDSIVEFGFSVPQEF